MSLPGSLPESSAECERAEAGYINAYSAAKIENIALSSDGCSVVIIDQSRLPNETVYLTLRAIDDMREAIRGLRVRGAPAIGIFAAYSLYCLARQILERDRVLDREVFFSRLREYKDLLIKTRPTAVNLSWALTRMEKVATTAAREASATASGIMTSDETGHILEALRREAISVQEEDAAMCAAISEYGLTLINDGDGILTHCNAGPLATSRYGTALGPMILGAERGMKFKVYADETRPLLQGARLTSYELSRAGVDVTLICDNMAGLVMKNGWVQACFVGCDRVAANGDTANKIGTSSVAVLAKYYDIPFYVLGPVSTIDITKATGDDIEIELRSPDEIRAMFFKTPVAPPEVACYNPAFDITDHSLISGIVTNKGICYPPYDKSVPALFEEKEHVKQA